MQTTIQRRGAEAQSPWQYKLADGRTVETCDVLSRVSKLRGMTASQLRDVMAWPGTQKTVRMAARRALDKIIEPAV